SGPPCPDGRIRHPARFRQRPIAFNNLYDRKLRAGHRSILHCRVSEARVRVFTSEPSPSCAGDPRLRAIRGRSGRSKEVTPQLRTDPCHLGPPHLESVKGAPMMKTASCLFGALLALCAITTAASANQFPPPGDPN